MTATETTPTDMAAGTGTPPTGATDTADPTDLDSIGEVVAGLRRTFESGRTRSLTWREAQLDALVRMLDEDGEELVDAMAADFGKPRLEAWAADVATTRNEVAAMRKHIRSWAEPEKVSLTMLAKPGKGMIVREPLGVCLVIAPWNYPVQLVVEPLAAALAAGNAVVAKPSELVPATSAVLARLIRTHLDTEAVAVVEGGPEVSQALLEQRFDHIFFTGSTAIGKIVAKAAAEHLTPTTLELGGKSPAIVHHGADLDVTAKRIAWGKFLNAGQTCIAPDYVLVERRVADELVDKVVGAIGEFYGADPMQSPDLANIVNDRHLQRLQGLLEDDGSGTVVTGGTVDTTRRSVAPTVLRDPDPDSPVMAEEIFGPILPVVAVDSVEDAVTFVNQRPKPLALYVFAEEESVAEQVVERTSSGGVCVNHTVVHITPPDLPFGGVGDSGQGRYHGKSGFDTFSNLKSVLVKPSKFDVALLYPPYTALKEKLIRWFL